MIKEFNFGATKSDPPQQVKTNTINVTITEYKTLEYKALWGVVSRNMPGIPTVGLDFQTHNKVFGINYNPI